MELQLQLQIQKRILGLPKEIQTIIYEYNAEHRLYTRKLNRELIKIIYPPCRVCRTPFKNELCGLDYFIIHKYKIYSHWCDINCFDEDHDSRTKLKCLEAVDRYMRERIK